MPSKTVSVKEAQAKPYARGKAAAGKRALNISIRADLVDEARASGLNLSRFVEEKLEEALRAERGRRWREENREAIEFHNRRIERDGMWSKGLTPWY
jgi:antitoxin CcdA